MCKSILYAANTAEQTVAVGGVVNFGTVVRRYGCDINLSGGNVITSGIGYYDIDTNITATAGGAGTMTLTLYKDGTAIPGATISKTVAADSIYAFTIPAVTRQKCCCESTLTCIVTGVEATVTNAAIVVSKD